MVSILPGQCYATEWLLLSSLAQEQSMMRWGQYDVTGKEIPCVFFASTIKDSKSLIIAMGLNAKVDLPL